MSRDNPSLAGPGGVRRIQARWVMMGRGVLQSAAHFGGEGGEATDMPLLRDARDGRPLLPGTSLAGALRSHLADVLDNYWSAEDGQVARLFGGARGDDAGMQSPLIVFDSLGSLPEGGKSEIRDGVAISPRSGTAEEHKKFDFEVLPAGTVFPLRLELVVIDGADEGNLVDLLRAALSGLAAGETALGARRSRGLGVIKVAGWRAHRFDLSSPEGWLGWLGADPLSPLPHDAPEGCDLGAALQRAWPAWHPTEPRDGRERLVIELELELGGGLLVRSPGTSPDEPDTSHLTSGGRPVLPGTSLAGVLRNRALRIARMVRSTQDDAEAWVARMFGPRRDERSGAGPEPAASRLRVPEATIRGGAPSRPSRVRIDRLTQGVVPKALFDEQPHCGGTACVRLELRRPKPGEAGLLLLVVKDVLLGDVAVGGTTSVGRGVVAGRGTLLAEDGNSFELSAQLPASEGVTRLNREIEEFREAAPLKTEGREQET